MPRGGKYGPPGSGSGEETAGGTDPTGGGANEETGSTSPSGGQGDDPTGGGANEETGSTSPTVGGDDDGGYDGASGDPGGNQGPISRVVDGVGGVLDGVTGGVDDVVDDVTAPVDDTVSRVRERVSDVGSDISADVGDVRAGVGDTVGDVSADVGDTIGDVGGVVDDVGVGETVDDVTSEVGGALGSVDDPLTEADSPVGETVDDVTAGLSGVAEEVGAGGFGATAAVGNQRAEPPEIGVGSGPTPSDFGAISESTLRDQAEAFRADVADPIGTTARRASPASLLDQALPGQPVGRSIENFTEGAIGLANVPAAAAGALSVADRAARDTRRANEEGAAGRRQNRQQLATDAIDAASSTGQAIQRDPVGALSRLGGAAVGGAFVGGAASRALRRTPDAPDTPEGAVPSGRSDVGTGGRGSILEDVDVDARRGVTGPSLGSRLGRAVDDSPLGDFLDDARGQAQLGRQRPRDTGEAVDRTRPADAGGSFEDVRQDALTQLQDDLRPRARRPDPGDFDGAGSPFRAGGGDTIDPDGGVSLTRSNPPLGDVGGATGSTAPGGFSVAGGLGVGALGGAAAATEEEADTGSALGGGTGAGSLGARAQIDPVNDPSGVAPDSDTDTGADSATRVGGGTGAGTRGILGQLDPVNDPSGVAPDSDTDTGADDATRVDDGTTDVPGRVSTIVGPVNDPTGISVRADADPAAGVDDTTAPLNDTGVTVDTGTRVDTGTDTATRTDTVTQSDQLADELGEFGLTGQRITDPTTADRDLYRRVTGGGGGGIGIRLDRRRKREEEQRQEDDEPRTVALGAFGDELDSGISSAEEELEGVGFGGGLGRGGSL